MLFLGKHELGKTYVKLSVSSTKKSTEFCLDFFIKLKLEV